MQRRLDTKNFARTYDVHELPSLIEVQLNSFNWFRAEGLGELFSEISPIESFNGNLKLYFPGFGPETEEFGLKYWFEEPKYDEDICLERDMTYAAPLYVRVALVNAKLIPDRGAWMEFETRKSDYLAIKFNRKRTIHVTILLRALAAVHDGMDKLRPIKTGSDEELLELYKEVDNNPDHPYIQGTIKMEPQWDIKDGQSIGQAALLEFYKRMRPGDPPTLDNARTYLESQLFDQRRYDLERVGRYKLNQRLRLNAEIPRSVRTITKLDLVKLIERMIQIN